MRLRSFRFYCELHLTTDFEMFDFDAQQFDVVDVSAVTLDDVVVTHDVNGDLGRYVENGSDRMRSRVAYKQVGFVFLFPWTIDVDHIQWTVTQ